MAASSGADFLHAGVRRSQAGGADRAQRARRNAPFRFTPAESRGRLGARRRARFRSAPPTTSIGDAAQPERRSRRNGRSASRRSRTISPCDHRRQAAERVGYDRRTEDRSWHLAGRPPAGWIWASAWRAAARRSSRRSTDRPVDRNPPDRRPRPQTIDVGGSYSLRRNIDVTAGVRYKEQDRDRLVAPVRRPPPTARRSMSGRRSGSNSVQRSDA